MVGVCKFWLSGRCNRSPCSFRHSNVSAAATPAPLLKRSRPLVWKKPGPNPPCTSYPDSTPAITEKNIKRAACSGPTEINERNIKRTARTDRSFSKLTRANHGYTSSSAKSPSNGADQNKNKGSGDFVENKERCAVENNKCSGDYITVENNFSLVATLQGHQTAITGIGLPTGGSGDKLFSGSKDGSLRAWDCHTGQSLCVNDLGGAVGCMISEGPWLFIGIPDAVKAWNSETNTKLITLLTARRGEGTAAGHVFALANSDPDWVFAWVFAGTGNGQILSWKYTAKVDESDCLEPTGCINGAHKLAIVSLTVGKDKLYSGSLDSTIRVWEITAATGALRSCLRTIRGHTDAVMSLICWDVYLISCSLDKTIKVWAMAETGDHLQEQYSHIEESELLSLAGAKDDLLLCSRNDNSLQLYDLPSFQKKGTIFSNKEVRAVHSWPGGHFFTGDATGDLKVWKWLTAEDNIPDIK